MAGISNAVALIDIDSNCGLNYITKVLFTPFST